MAHDEVTAPEYRVYWSAGRDYVRCDLADGAVVTGQDAPEQLAAIALVGGEGAVPVLVDLRGATSVSREARTAFANSDGATRLALYVESALSRVIANFFIGVSGPRVPTKVFDDVDAAQRWLLDDE